MRHLRDLALDEYRTVYGRSVHELEMELEKTQPPAQVVDLRHGDVLAFPPYGWSVAEFARRVESGAAYTPYQGSGDVRVALAESIGRQTGVKLDPDENIMLTAGTQAGLFCALASLVERGTGVLLPDPEYFSTEKIIRFLGGEILRVPLRVTAAGSAKLDYSVLEETGGEAKVLVLSNPNNPTGAVYETNDIDRILDLAERHDWIVLADELYWRLTYGRRAFRHFMSKDATRYRVATLMGPSKTESLSGYRVGTLLGTSSVIENATRVLSLTALRAPGYAQGLLARWMCDDEAWINFRIEKHRRLRDHVVSRLRSIPEVNCPLPGGSSYVFVDVSKRYSDEQQLALELKREYGVLINPGYQFGPGNRGHFRINFSQRREALEFALDAIERVL